MCNITKCCTEVCPENIKITDNGDHPVEGTRGRHQVRPDPVPRLEDRPCARSAVRRSGPAVDGGRQPDQAPARRPRPRGRASPPDRGPDLAPAPPKSPSTADRAASRGQPCDVECGDARPPRRPPRPRAATRRCPPPARRPASACSPGRSAAPAPALTTPEPGDLLALASRLARSRRRGAADRAGRPRRSTQVEPDRRRHRDGPGGRAGHPRRPRGRARPDDAVVTEESAAPDRQHRVRWFVDPLDGTVNYLYGLPQYAVSIARRGRRRAGLRRRARRRAATWSTPRPAAAGRTCNGRPITCSTQTDPALSLVATGLLLRAARRGAQARTMAPSCRRSATSGGSARRRSTCARWPPVGRRLLRGGHAPVGLGGRRADRAGGRRPGRRARGKPPGGHTTLAANPVLFAALHHVLVAAARGRRGSGCARAPRTGRLTGGDRGQELDVTSRRRVVIASLAGLAGTWPRPASWAWCWPPSPAGAAGRRSGRVRPAAPAPVPRRHRVDEPGAPRPRLGTDVADGGTRRRCRAQAARPHPARHRRSTSAHSATRRQLRAAARGARRPITSRRWPGVELRLAGHRLQVAGVPLSDDPGVHPEADRGLDAAVALGRPRRAHRRLRQLPAADATGSAPRCRRRGRRAAASPLRIGAFATIALPSVQAHGVAPRGASRSACRRTARCSSPRRSCPSTTLRARRARRSSGASARST